MPPIVVVFEDHSVVDFRPLAWSLPLYEIRGGLLNLRERFERDLPEVGGQARLGLLPRGLLAALQELNCEPGTVVGVEACRAAAQRGGALFVNARLGALARFPGALCRAAAGQEWAWADEGGLLACALGPARAVAWLAAWADWEKRAAAAGVWSRDARRPAAFAPDLADLGPCPVDPTEGRQQGAAWRGLWELVPGLGEAIGADCALTAAQAGLPPRRPFGIVPDPGAWPDQPPWAMGTTLAKLAGGARPDLHVQGEVWIGSEASLAPGTVIDGQAGPVVLDRGVQVQPHCYLQGPLYIGPATLVKAGARIYGETSIGAGCRVAGEIAESLFLDFVNKQHEGFIGHAVLGAWVNLGAGTTCSDLKNNYGAVRIDYGLGPVDTGLRFVGVSMAEHAKSAIGTLFNTGSVVGFASNVFGAGFPPKTLPNYTWGDPAGAPYDAKRAAAVAATVMARRGCRFLPAHERLFLDLARSD